MSRPPQDEKLPKLCQSVAQPLPVAIGHADHRGGHRDELVRLEVDERRGFGFADACSREEKCRRDAKYRGKTGEHRGAGLLDTTCLELGDRGTRDTDTAGELGLGEVQLLACGPDRERQRGPCRRLRDDRNLAR